MDELDEIDQDLVHNRRNSYIALLEEAEKPMQELVKFWRDCGLITEQRNPSHLNCHYCLNLLLQKTTHHSFTRTLEKTHHQAPP